jgi:hypothetical protein
LSTGSDRIEQISALDRIIRSGERDVTLEQLRATGRAAFRVVRRADLVRDLLGLVDVLLDRRVRDVERQLAETLDARERRAHEDGILRVLDSLVDLADLVDGIAGSLEGRDGVLALKALDRRVDHLFATHGFARIATTGATFDPDLHEAVDSEESGGAPGVIVREVSRGYARDGFVLRVARVIVATGRA